MNEKPIYEQEAPKQKASIKGFFGVIILVAVLMIAANCLPYSGILTLPVLVLGAYLMLKLMNGGLFPIKYALFTDRLSFVRKYGYLENEAEVFPLDEAHFFDDHIEHRGKSYEFHPDKKLKGLLNMEII